MIEIGTCYMELRMMDQALAVYLGAIDWYKSQKSALVQRNYGTLLTNMGNVYTHLAEWERAAACFREALDVV